MKLSLYSYLFDARLRDFNAEETVANFVAFADEVVFATIPSEDDTYERLKALESQYAGKFRVVMTDISLSNNRFDGDLKTAALQACTKSTDEDPRLYIIADADERFRAETKQTWLSYGKLIWKSKLDGILLPVLDLYGDENSIRADQNIGLKFRIHKDTVVKRGVIPQAELGNGLFSTEKSDSTEPILANGQLARFAPVEVSLNPQDSYHLSWVPHVFHLGHLDSTRRVKLNKEFWFQHWKNRSGENPKMVMDEGELSDVATIPHNLRLWK